MDGPVMLGSNYLSDVAVEEFKLNILSNKVPNLHAEAEEEQLKAPASIDWVSKGAVTPIVNQGECKSAQFFSCGLNF